MSANHIPRRPVTNTRGRPTPPRTGTRSNHARRRARALVIFAALLLLTLLIIAATYIF